MPADAVYFYSKMNGAYLHESDSKFDLAANGKFWKWTLLPATAIESVAQSGWSYPDTPLHEHHKYWFNILDVQNSDYLAISTQDGHVGEVIDVFHETVNEVGYNTIVATSFTELLQKLLSSNEPFWLKPDKTNYGCY